MPTNQKCPPIGHAHQSEVPITIKIWKIWAASRQNQQNGMCAQRRLRSAWASAVWSEPSLCAQWVGKDPNFLHVDIEDSEQTGWMPRMIRVFAGHTCQFVGFVMGQLICTSKLSNYPKFELSDLSKPWWVCSFKISTIKVCLSECLGSLNV